MSGERGSLSGLIRNKSEAEARTPEETAVLIQNYRSALDKILEEAAVDSYWTSTRALDDGETGSMPFVVVGAIDKILSKLEAA